MLSISFNGILEHWSDGALDGWSTGVADCWSVGYCIAGAAEYLGEKDFFEFIFTILQHSNTLTLHYSSL
jgi:hypothetical protein